MANQLDFQQLIQDLVNYLVGILEGSGDLIENYVNAI